MNEAVIVSGARTAVGRAPRGTLRGVHPVDLGASAIREAVGRAEGLDPSDVEDVIMGCAMPEGTQGYNMARLSSVRAGMPDTVPAQTVNRFCSSGLQTIAMAAERIMVGHATTIVAGGTEHMSSTLQMPNFAPDPGLVETNPAVYMGMGFTAEQVAREFDVSREDQDEFALRSHTRAKEAVEGGLFDDEIVPLDVAYEFVDDDGRPQHFETTFGRDEGPRDTSAEQLAKLKPAFQQGGTVTAGNASQLSDGAAAVVVASKRAVGDRKPLARIISYATSGGPPKDIFIAPVPAVRTALAKADLKLSDIDLFELNEAFAAQMLACGKELGLDEAKVNVNGGAVALGHPIGGSGARVLTTLIHTLHRQQKRYGLASLCLGGGNAVAMVIERV